MLRGSPGTWRLGGGTALDKSTGLKGSCGAQPDGENVVLLELFAGELECQAVCLHLRPSAYHLEIRIDFRLKVYG